VFLQNCQRAFSYLLHVGMLLGKAATWLTHSFLPPRPSPGPLAPPGVPLHCAGGGTQLGLLRGQQRTWGRTLWGIAVLVGALMQLLGSVMLAPCLASLVLITNTGAALVAPIWQALALSVAICVRPVVQAGILIFQSAAFLVTQLSRAMAKVALLQAGVPWAHPGCTHVCRLPGSALPRRPGCPWGYPGGVLLIPNSLPQAPSGTLFSKGAPHRFISFLQSTCHQYPKQPERHFPQGPLFLGASHHF